MASGRPSRLQTGSLPILDEDSASTTSPARGRETRNHLLSKLRPPPLVHAWDFWHEKPSPSFNPSNASTTPSSATTTQDTSYASQLTHLHSCTDVRAFWSLYNNVSFTTLPIRHSIHLFHATIKPLWEDPRNMRGGCWTFRVPKAHASAVFEAVCLLAIGEQLQEAVYEEGVTSFRDDICGVSYRQRPSGGLVLVWNRDAQHSEGIRRIRECVEGALNSSMKLPEGAAFYKAHSAHDGFNASPPSATTTDSSTPASATAAIRANDAYASLAETEDKHAIAAASVEAMEREVEKVKRILEEVQLNEERMGDKLEGATGEGEDGTKGLDASKHAA